MATIIVGTNSYVTEAELSTYAADRGIAIAGDTSQLLIKAMDYIESFQYFGEKADDDQALEFPRDDETTVPDDIKKAQIVTALIYDGGGDPLAEISQKVLREKVDVIDTQYSESSSSNPVYPLLNRLLSPYLASGGGSVNVRVTKA